MSIEILTLPADHVEAACELFSSVFGHAISPAQWDWKYRQGPRMGHVNVAARDEAGRWVGHAGAIVFPGAFLGRPLAMAQVCDIMVARAARGGLAREGVYPRLVAALRRRLAEGFPGVFAYGFPGVRPFGLGERLGFYRRLYDCREGDADDAGGSAVGPWGWRARQSDWDTAVLDGLWRRLGPRQAEPLVARTGSYLAWRYRDHPRHDYRLWLLTRWFAGAGWMVTREMPDGSRLVVDALLARSSDAPPACGAVRAALERVSGARTTLRTWMPVPRAEPRGIVATEFLVGKWHVDLPAPRFHPGDTDVY